MDRTNHQNAVTSGLFMHSLSLKNVIIITGLIMTVCALYFLSPSLSLFFRSFNYSHLSMFSLRDLFTNTTGRKSACFLVCNGILAFLAMVRSSRPASDGDHELFKDESSSRSDPRVLGNDALVLEEEGAVDEDENDHVIGRGRAETKDIKARDEEGERGHRDTKEDEQVEESEFGFIIDEEEEEEGGEEKEEEKEEEEEEGEGKNGLLSADELNRKFDEFIRRMKEEIRIEAQQQLVMVH